MAEELQLTLVNGCNGVLLVEQELLTWALANLIANAIRYANTGTAVNIASRTEAVPIVISVHNRGPCVAPELLPRLFERFYRANPSKSPPGALSYTAQVKRRHSLQLITEQGLTI